MRANSHAALLSVVALGLQVLAATMAPECASAHQLTAKPDGHFSPRKDSEAYLGLEELRIPAFTEGRKHSRHFEIVDKNQKHIKLHYDVELAEDTHFISLDHEQGVTHIRCQNTIAFKQHPHDGTLVIRYDTSANAAAAYRRMDAFDHRNIRITAGRAWECPRHDGMHQALWLRVADAAPVIDGNEITFPKVLQADPQHLFKNADVHFSVSKFPQDHFKEHSFTKEDTPQPQDDCSWMQDMQQPSTADVARTQTKERRAGTVGGWFSNFFVGVWNKIKTLGHTVVTVVKTVVVAVKVLVTGDYVCHKTFLSKSWAWNYDPSTGQARKPVPVNKGVTCDNCYYTMELQFNLDLVLKDYKLLNVSIYAEGQGDVSVLSNLNMQIDGGFGSSVQVAQIEMPAINFQLGPVPIYLDMDVPIHIGYEIDWQVKAHMEVSATASGYFRYGIGYNPQDDFHLIHITNFTHNGTIGAVKLGAQVSATVYVLATLVINVDCIGGPDIGIKPYLEGAISIDNQYYDPCYEAAKFSANWGLQGTIGGHIDIRFPKTDTSIYEHQFNSTSIFNIKKPILTGCIQEPEQFVSYPKSLPPPSSVNVIAENGVSRTLTIGNRCSPPGMQPAEYGCTPGSSWIGELSSYDGRCAAVYPEQRTLSFQATDTTYSGTGAIIEFIGTTNDVFLKDESSGVEIQCTFQQTFCASAYSYASQLSFKAQPCRGGPDTSQFSKCTSSDGSACTCTSEISPFGVGSGMIGTYSPGFATITLTDPQGCASIVMTRVGSVN